MNSYTKDLDNNEVSIGKEVLGGLENFDSNFLKHGSYQDNSTFDFGDENAVQIDTSQFQLCKEDTTTSLNGNKEEDPIFVPSLSLGVLQNYTKGIKRLSSIGYDPKPRPRLSIEDILRLAGEKFIQTSSRKVCLSRQFDTNLSLVSLSLDEAKEVDIVQKLLSAAEKYSQKKYDQARKFLDQCDSSSSNKGNQIDRTVYYFSKSLREKIDRETGIVVSSKDSLKKVAMHMDKDIMKASPVMLAFHQEVPLSQINVYATMQEIIERVTGATRIHVIDLEIRSGLHFSVLMQALADRVECPIELLKITAVTTKAQWIVEDTGKRLRGFAKSINLPFIFNLVLVPNIPDLNVDLFDLESREIVVVNTLFGLKGMIGRQNELEYLIGVIKSINPCVMVVAEVEGKHNSPVFVNRFIEVLFYYGAYFDCVEDCMDRSSPLRLEFESLYFGNGIRNMLVAEGDERTYRNVNLDIWRVFFSRFDMTEEELSPSSLIQARFFAKTYACWNSCTIDKDGKSLIIGWKGMPLQHVSAWRFKPNNPISVLPPSNQKYQQ